MHNNRSVDKQDEDSLNNAIEEEHVNKQLYNRIESQGVWSMPPDAVMHAQERQKRCYRKDHRHADSLLDPRRNDTIGKA